MKLISELDFGFSDAQNYRKRSQKEKFKKWFIKDKNLARLCSDDISFIIGEKGTGKTSYAVFLSNEEYNGISSDMKFLKETDYKQFIFLKKEHHLIVSDYESVWEMILLLIMSKKIIDDESNILHKISNGKFGKFKKLTQAIDEYFLNSFNPEVASAIQMVKESGKAAEVFAKHVKLSANQKHEERETKASFQRNIYYITKQFKDAFSELSLEKNHMIFIDGIDIRPSDIDHNDYLECIKGLSSAVWNLNNDFFPNIRDSKGRSKYVLLIRPDIFDSLGLHNPNAKITDNSIVLKWNTNYDNHRNSPLFSAVEKLIDSQCDNDASKVKVPWDFYFPWEASTLEFALPEGQKTSFISFLRLSYHRPRDIFTMLKILQVQCSNDESKEQFSLDDFKSPTFQREYSNYLLGEVKDQLSFYYKASDYEFFLKFFSYLNGKSGFTYQEYNKAFIKMDDYLGTISYERPKFMSSANDFLQFLYELNVISFIEPSETANKNVVRWCFRERTSANLFPKVKINADSYEIFYGLRKALQVDIQVKSR